MNKQKNKKKIYSLKKGGKSIFGWLWRTSQLLEYEAAKSFKFPYHWILLHFIYVNKIKKKKITQRRGEKALLIWMRQVVDTQKIRREIRGTIRSEINWITWGNFLLLYDNISISHIKLLTQLWKELMFLICFWGDDLRRGCYKFLIFIMFCNAAST